MLVSAREAAAILALEAGLAREPARRALAAGLAGEALRTAGSLLYDADLVRALATRRHVRLADIPAVCRAGLFVARLNPTRLKGTPSPGGWHVSPWVRVRIRSRIEATGSFPFLATVAGYVTEGADITGFDFDHEGDVERTSFKTLTPGPWFDTFQGRRFDTGPGGPWLLWQDGPGRSDQSSSRPCSIA